jgi:predicted alpha-1,6-mannanase (GH76 family)
VSFILKVNMVMKKIICPFLILVLVSIKMLCIAQPGRQEYANRIKIIQQNIQRYFYDSTYHFYNEFYPADTSNKKKYSYLWPLCGLIQAANETDGALITSNYFDTVLAQIQPYYDDAPPKPGYNSYIVHPVKEARFYDDNQWIGIACMDAYRRTKNDKYLLQVKMVYNFMMSGFDTVSGGGLYWKERDLSTKNTCSNGPGVLVALQLYKATKNKSYLDTALMLYDWVNKKLLTPANLYFDNIQLPSGKIDKRIFTYNAGTMLQSSVILYHLTGEKKYLIQANKIAAASLQYFYKNNSFPDNYWFNAVLLRGYIELYKANQNKKYIIAMQQYGETIWQNEKTHQNIIGKHKRKELLDQAAMMEIFASLAQVSVR